MDAQISKEAYEIAAKQKKLGYQIKRNKASYLMLAPYFILPVYGASGGHFHRLKFHVFQHARSADLCRVEELYQAVSRG